MGVGGSYLAGGGRRRVTGVLDGFVTKIFDTGGKQNRPLLLWTLGGFSEELC